MREPGFWARGGGVATLLAPLGVLYGAIAARRMAQPGGAAGIPVLCIGNLTAGGAGKTPAAIAVVELVKAAGGQPFALSRGYGGKLHGPVQVDPDAHTADDVGDEPLLLARAAPTIVARDRVAGAAMARSAGATVVVMDDGFQNPALRKDASLLVVDAERGIGNGLIMPAGPLRAPLGSQIALAQAILVVGEGDGAAAVLAAAPHLPVFRGRLEPDGAALVDLRGRKVLAFAGIGYPDKFFDTLAQAGVDVTGRRSFPDHHRYSRADARGLLEQAERGSLVPVTTEKDLARMAGRHELRELAAAARALPVSLQVSEADAFRDFVLAAATGQARSG